MPADTSDSLSQPAPLVPSPKPLSEILEQGYHVRTADYLKQGWRNFWSYPIGLLAFVLLFTILSQVPLLLGPWLGQLLSVVVTVVMMTGVALLVWRQLGQRAVSFPDLFPGWSTVGQLILCTVIGTIMTIAGFFLFVIPGIYLLVAYTFSYMLIADRGLSAWQALEMSRRVVNKNWWGAASLVVLTILLIAGGILLGALLLGAPLGIILARYYPVVNAADFFSDPPDAFLSMNIPVNQGMVVGVSSGIILGMGLGVSLASCMLAVAYADIFGLSGSRAQPAHQ